MRIEGATWRNRSVIKTDKDASTQQTDDENCLMHIVDSVEEDRTASEFEFRNQSQAVDLLPSKYAIESLINSHLNIFLCF